MTSPEPFTIRHPYFSAVGFLLIVLGVVLGFGALNEFFLMSTVEQVALGDLVLAIIGIFLVIRLRWWAKSGFTKGIKWADVPLFILPAAVSLLSLSGGIRVSSVVTILTFAAVTLVVGFAEETYFRGLILTSLIPTGVFRAVIISSFFFAAPHLLNTIGGVWDPSFAIVDSVAAFGLGFTFAALRTRTGSIWPLIGIHALFDFTSLITLGGFAVPSQSSQVLITSVIVGVGFTAYGFFLLQGSKIKVPEQITG
ncbi:MAG: type II CAAX endopeptidase family protein [Methanoregula sp.]|uniref:CPBP family intramembrane glutamic endopeptidase n=1 Tax=Methanoregula sp. TaxID=2052170 RepID=UPI003BAE5E15